MTTIDLSRVNLLEKDIEDWLYEHPQVLGVEKWIARQFQVPSGVIDLLGVMIGTPVPVVVEIKNVEIDSPAILQVCRYAADIADIVDIRTNKRGNCYVFQYVIGRGPISAKVQYEADSVEVKLFSFSVNLELQIGGPWYWKDEKREIDYRVKAQLAGQDDVFGVFDPYIVEPIKEDEPQPDVDTTSLEAFKEFLNKQEGEEAPGKD